MCKCPQHHGSLHCKDSRVVLTLLWLSQLQNRYYCAAEVAIHGAMIHVHNYYAHRTLYMLQLTQQSHDNSQNTL